MQAFLVTVRNKKRVGYTYELTLRVKGNCCFYVMISHSCNSLLSPDTFSLLTLNFIFICLGEWLIGSEKKKVKGHIDIEEFSFGELDDLQVLDGYSLVC